MSIIIALANQKGGVAKTTSTHALGASIAEKGKKVLMVDLDSQASLTISVGLEPLDIGSNIYSLLQKNGRTSKECIQELKSNLHIITSIIDLAQLEMEMLSRASREKILDRALEPIKEDYDYILIDCPPQLSILTINALSCADGVIIPVKTDYLAYRGLAQLNDTVAEIKSLINSKLIVLGVIATFYETRTSDDRAILALLQRDHNVIGIVKKAADAKKGILEGLSIVEKFPNSDVALEYKEIANMIISGCYERAN